MVDTNEEAYNLAKDIKMSMVTKPALNMLEVFLPEYVTKEFNEYIDGVRGSAKSFSHELVGQIKSNEKSAQLDMDFEDKPVKGLKALLEGFTKSYLQFLGCADAKSDCVSICGQFTVMKVIIIHYTTTVLIHPLECLAFYI